VSTRKLTELQCHGKRVVSLSEDAPGLQFSRIAGDSGGMFSGCNHSGYIGEGGRRGGRLEYLHHNPVSRRRRRKGNPVPGGITRPPYHWEHKYRDLGPQVGGWTQD
jgi:hypothetical protein